MNSSRLRRASLYLLSVGLAACGSGDHSSPVAPTAPQGAKPVPVVKPVETSPGIPMPVETQGSKPPGFEAVIRVNPRPNGDGIIVGDAPLSVEFDVCGSRSGDGRPLTYLFDWDMDHRADATGSGENCRQQHTYTLRHHPDAQGHVLYETNVCVVSGNPVTEGPDTYYSCRKYTLNLGVPTQGCADGTLSNTLPASVSGSTVGADNTFQPNCGCASNSPDQTYRFTANSATTYTFDAQGSGYDTVLAVFDGCGGAQLACNDDFYGLQSKVDVSLTAGQSVIVVISGFCGSNGSYTVNAND